MTSLEAHLEDGYVILRDSSGEVAAEWHDKFYAADIACGLCTVERWHEMLEEMAIEEGWLIVYDGWSVARAIYPH
jgi:hypothetical protein